jgi:TolB-like protein
MFSRVAFAETALRYGSQLNLSTRAVALHVWANTYERDLSAKGIFAV